MTPVGWEGEGRCGVTPVGWKGGHGWHLNIATAGWDWRGRWVWWRRTRGGEGGTGHWGVAPVGWEGVQWPLWRRARRMWDEREWPLQ